MSERTTIHRGRVAVALSVGFALSLVMGLVPALASHPEVSLAGSNFEIDLNANLRVNDPAPPSIDWANVADLRQADEPTGANDDSFGQGAKEDTAVPTIVDGSIPPNKSDLLNFGVYFEETAGGREFLNVFWHRVQEPQGTTNMDFEFNQSEELSDNTVTPERTSGDILIQYDLAQGGINPELFLSRWIDETTDPPVTADDCEAANSLPCWSARISLSDANDAAGSINTSAILAAESDGLGNISPRTFGEAQIDFDALVGGTSDCVGFGSAYLKSRSSDSFTAALKDFIKPREVDINRCGSIHVIKHDDATPPALLAGAEFDLVKDNPPVNNAGGPGAEDTFVDDCVTVAGVCDFSDVLQGEYWVVETDAPTGHNLPTPPYQHVTVVTDEQVTVTFVNPRLRGAIQLTKTEKHAAEADGVRPHAGVSFTIAGQAVVTDANGQACVGGLTFGSYDVVETVPATHVADGPTTKSVTVDQAGTCTSGFETVSFSNTPLSDITVSFSSQVPGGTAATIECTGQAATPPDGTPIAYDDTSETFDDLVPGTYNCTVVIDP